MKTQNPHSFIKGNFSTIVLLMVVMIHFILIYLGWQFQLQEFKSISAPPILQVDLINTLPNKPALLSPAQITITKSNNTIQSNSSNPIKALTSKSDTSRNTNNLVQALQTNHALNHSAKPNTNQQVPIALNDSTQANLKATESVLINAAQSTTVNNANAQLNTPNTNNLTTTVTAIKIEKPNAFAAHLQNPKPIYPKRSRELGEQGIVVLSIWVDTDGKPDKVQIIKSSGFPRLDDAAQRQISESWRFVPGQKNGQKEAMELIQRIPFTLNEATP